MRRTAIVISLVICWIALLLGASPAVASSATQDALLASCQKIQQNLTLPAETSAEQRALVALNIAIGQSQPLDGSVDIAEVLRKASTFTTYGVQSDTFYNWESPSWVGSHRSTYTYSGIRQTGETQQTFSASVWVNSTKTITTYNGDGTPSTVTAQDWSDGNWVNSSLISFTYSGGLTSTMVMQTWSGSDWVNFTKSTTTYSDGHLTMTVTESWVSSAWVNTSKATYTYTGSNLTEWIMQSWVSSAWVNQMRNTMTYDGSNNETQSIMYMWQSSAWVTASKYDYTYDGSGNEILSVNSTAAGPSWVPMEADTSKWSGGNETEIVHNHLVPPSVFRSQFTYDLNGNNTVELGQDWSGSEWVNSDRAVYVYQVLAVEVDNGRIPSEFELSQNYPNPFNPATVIRYSLSRPSPVEIIVFNLLGQEVKTLENGLQSAGVYETTWDGTNRMDEKVASGIYFYRIKAGENVETRKMLLLK